MSPHEYDVKDRVKKVATITSVVTMPTMFKTSATRPKRRASTTSPLLEAPDDRTVSNIAHGQILSNGQYILVRIIYEIFNSASVNS